MSPVGNTRLCSSQSSTQLSSRVYLRPLDLAHSGSVQGTLGAGITGYSLKSRVRLPVLTGLWVIYSLFFSVPVEGVFSESQWHEPWRQLGVPVPVGRKGKEREAPISEGCNGVCFIRSPHMVDCRRAEVSPSRPIPCRGSVVGDGDNRRDRP